MASFDEYYTVRGYHLQEKDRQVTESMEDYMEMISRLCTQSGSVRVGEIARELHIADSSVTKMVHKLAQRGLLDYHKHAAVLLTEQGKALGDYLINRHREVGLLLQNLGVTDELFRQTELIEHQITPRTLQTVSCFNRYMKDHPELLDALQRAQESSP